MERIATIGEERGIGDAIEVGGTGEDAPGLVVPIFVVASFVDFGFDGGESLQQELAMVGESASVLARDAAGDLMKENFAESDVNGGGRLEIADGGEDVRGDDVAGGDAAHFSIEMMVAESRVAGIVEGGAALAVGAKMLAAAIGGGRGRRYGAWGGDWGWGGRDWRWAGWCCYGVRSAAVTIEFIGLGVSGHRLAPVS